MSQEFTSIVHDFMERLAFSQAMGAEEAAWITFYQEAWPTLISIVRIDAQSRYQQWGIDRHVYLPAGKILAIDEKVRDPEHARDRDGDPYDDVLIEEWSVWHGERDPRNRIGWALDPHKCCDYVAYALPLLQRCYLLPFELLRMACQARLPEWKRLKDKKGRRCYPLDAVNRGYVTRNCAVAWPILQAAIAEQIQRHRGANALILPTPTIRGRQACFDWTTEP